VVGRDGVATDPEKVQAVKEWAVPRDLPELRAFLGLVGYYRQYIPSFAGVPQPLNRLTAKGDSGSGRRRSRKHLTTLSNG